jgi:hypothetical protein
MTIITGDQGYTPFTAKPATEDIDASTATWNLKNTGSKPLNPYPFQVIGGPEGMKITGGNIVGEVDQVAEWRDIYENSAAVRTENVPGVWITGWRIDKAWDAIRVSWNCPGFLVSNIWASDCRDDAVENDRALSGNITDCLFDGFFSGISIDPSSSSPIANAKDQTVTMDGVLLRMKVYLYEGEVTHESFIKTDSAAVNKGGANTPSLRFRNCVFAMETPNHHSFRSMTDAWIRTVESTGNFLLNLSDEPFPAKYPMPPAGWTVLSGAEARAKWDSAKAAWIAKRNGVVEPPPVDPPDDPPDEPIDASAEMADMVDAMTGAVTALAVLKAKLGL